MAATSLYVSPPHDDAPTCADATVCTDATPEREVTRGERGALGSDAGRVWETAGVTRGARLLEAAQSNEAEQADLEALRGRLVELVATPGSAALSVALSWIGEAHRRGEPAAWLTGTAALPMAEDICAHGVDLDALALVRAPDAASAGRAAERLLRSGAFGAIVVEVHQGETVSDIMLRRIARLADQHRALVALIIRGTAPRSHGSLVSLRMTTVVERGQEGIFGVQRYREKDKRRGPGDAGVEWYRGPDGLC